MDIKQLLQGIDCACGKKHTCPIDFVAVERGAAKHLETLCRKQNTLLIVADENTFLAAGEATLSALNGKNIKKVIFPGDSILIPNEDAVAAVNAQLSGAEKIIGIGSGVIQDLCKYVSHESGIPYCIVATAPSMDGYASTGAAMIMGGMKVTYPAGLPEAILADPAVLKDAPMEMIRAGYGDIVGKYSALNDWLLSREVNGEYFCQTIYDLTFDMVKQTLALAKGLMNRDEESVRVLMEALVVVGIAMSFAGSSRPASGSEHHLSHFFEITGIVHGKDYFPHGIDVAYSTIETARLREEILKNAFPDTQYRPTREEYVQEMNRLYGSVADGCIALQDKVGLYKKDMLSIYKAREENIRAILADMPTAQQIEEMLAAAGYDKAEFYALYGEEKIRDAILYAKELKDRYTVLWLYYDLFGGK
ncbi:MAG: sn-glycerol-1-phosphate dehydrogenase [Clostridiales bacterium]|nr:sn-glycerol-1-phosphate dehydrogenase [Clostridiales bacterium]